RGVDLARHEQEHEKRAEAAAAHRPLLEVHGVAALGEHAEREREQQEREEDDERRVHARGARSSRAEITAITPEVTSTQPTIHTRSRGTPPTVACRRSISGTPTQIPIGGRSASQR